jgi:hypothetical protein
MSKPKLLTRRQALRAGYELAPWDELLAFGREESLPPYARAALLKRLKAVVLPHIKGTSGKGRKARALEEQQQIFDDFVALETVKWWREQRRRYKSGRVRRFSWRQSFERTGKQLYMSPSAVRDACRRAKKRNKEGFYVSELFLRTITVR